MLMTVSTAREPAASSLFKEGALRLRRAGSVTSVSEAAGPEEATTPPAATAATAAAPSPPSIAPAIRASRCPPPVGALLPGPFLPLP
eukprot:scaffold17503_cov72-Isochrysis_galbana.AAC.1